MSIFSKLITLFRGASYDAGAAVVDANALRILDQEIRDADNALGRARDDLATLVAKRRMTEKELQNLKDQSARYESSARAALELIASHPRLDGTAVQTVGSKGYDGFALARVLD